MTVFTAASVNTLRSLGVVRARYLVEEGYNKLEPFAQAPNEYWITVYLLEMLGVLGMFWSGYVILSMMPIESWGIWLILAGCYFICHTALGVAFARGDERQKGERFVMLLKPFYLCLKPLTSLLSKFNRVFPQPQEKKFSDAERIEEELEVMLDESTRQGGLENIKGRIMKSAIDYSETTVREVMIPRTDLTAISVDMSMDEALELCVKEGYSRLPVYEGNLDTIVGVLYFKDLVEKFFELRNDDKKRQSITLHTLVREAYFVPETNHIDTIFEDFKREHIHMAIVVDEFGGTAGIVTLEDIVEEFFGEIQDEYDSEETTIVSLDNQEHVLVDAKTNISEICELFDVEIEENPDFESVGGLVSSHLGHVGTIGESVEVANLQFIVRDANERCVLQVEISRVPVAESKED